MLLSLPVCWVAAWAAQEEVGVALLQVKKDLMILCALSSEIRMYFVALMNGDRIPFYILGRKTFLWA